jgi:hypothetical protein
MSRSATFKIATALALVTLCCQGTTASSTAGAEGRRLLGKKKKRSRRTAAPTRQPTAAPTAAPTVPAPPDTCGANGVAQTGDVAGSPCCAGRSPVALPPDHCAVTRATGTVTAQFAGEPTARTCTGTVIRDQGTDAALPDHSVVLTSAHCVGDISTGAFPESASFLPDPFDVSDWWTATYPLSGGVWDFEAAAVAGPSAGVASDCARNNLLDYGFLYAGPNADDVLLEDHVGATDLPTFAPADPAADFVHAFGGDPASGEQSQAFLSGAVDSATSNTNDPDCGSRRLATLQLPSTPYLIDYRFLPGSPLFVDYDPAATSMQTLVVESLLGRDTGRIQRPDPESALCAFGALAREGLDGTEATSGGIRGMLVGGGAC